MRSHAISGFLTSAQEQLIEPHDYRTINIELELGRSGQGFDLLAAEVMLLRLQNEGYELSPGDFNKEYLFYPGHVEARNTDVYKTAVLGRAKQIFPQLSVRDLANLFFSNKALKN